jgi:acetamidase/formamidase
LSGAGGGTTTTTTTIDEFLAAQELAPHQAYVLLSVVVDVRIGNLDVPSFALPAVLPLKVFVGGP